MVPASAETSLTKILINKLRGFAYYAVEDEPCETISQLADLLNGAFGPRRDVDQCRGDLANIFRRGGEHMLEYISRAKTLRNDVLDAERRSRGRLDHRIAAEIDSLTTKAFCNGLGLEYRLQMRPEQFASPFDAFAEAKILAGREELDRSRVSNHSRRNSTFPAPPLLAHSTPERNRAFPRAQPATQNRYYSPTNDFDNPRRAGYSRETNSRSPDNYRNYDNRNTRDNANYRNDNRPKWCRYCKNTGHEIEECRKREFNNSHPRQGNAGNPSRMTDESRAGRSQDQSRPINAIETQPISEANDELQS